MKNKEGLIKDRVEILLEEIDKKLGRTLTDSQIAALREKIQTTLKEKGAHKKKIEIMQNEFVSHFMKTSKRKKVDQETLQTYEGRKFEKLPAKVRDHLILNGDTVFQPGSSQRLEIYASRRAMGFSIFHDNDLRYVMPMTSENMSTIRSLQKLAEREIA